MSISYWLNLKEKRKNHRFDVVIIGAGISGVSTAYWLKKEDPNLKIAVVDKSFLAAGASGRNAGFVTCGSVEHFNRLVSSHGKEKALNIWRFSEENLRLLEEEIIDGSDLFEFSRNGSFSLAASESEANELKKTADLMTGMKIPVEYVSEGQIKDRLHIEGFVAGIKYLQDATTHPVRLVEKIAAKSNVEFFEGCEVFDIDSSSADEVLVKTQNGDFSCGMVVLAGNGYLPLYDPYFVDKVFPTRGQILITEPLEKAMEGPCYANFYLDYFRQLPSGEFLVGGFRQLERDVEKGYSDHTSPVIQEALEEFIEKHLPMARGKKILHRWGGVMGFSKDGQPLIGSLPNEPRVFFLGGYTGHGLGLAFHCAKTLVDLIFGREIPDFVSARRF